MADSKSWELVKVFEDGNLRIRITKSDHHPRPRYSMELTRINEDDKSVRHFGVYIETSNAQCKLRESIADRVCKLWRQAEDWILEASQIREDEIWNEKRTREEVQANRDKPVVRQTGKTERERHKSDNAE